VSQVYLDLLQRPVDSAGLAGWSGQLDRGTTREQIVQAIEGSAEYRAVVVQTLYCKFLARNADSSGLDRFSNLLAQGGTAGQVKASLLASDEYFSTRGGDTKGFLQVVYQDVLNRPIDQSGLQMWSQALANGTSRGVVASSILGSREAEADEVKGLYLQLLGRAADAGGLDFFVGQLQSGVSSEAIRRQIMVSGEYFTNLPRARYQAGGSLDSSFGMGGKVLTDFGANMGTANTIALQADDKIVVAGTVAGNFALARYNVDGSLDNTFGTGGQALPDSLKSLVAGASGLALQDDGKIVAAGSAGGKFAVARFNPNGSVDNSFGTAGEVTTQIGPLNSDFASGVAVQPDGKIVVVGSSRTSFSITAFALTRYNADGSLDSSFGTGGTVLTDFPDSLIAQAAGVKLQSNGKIVVVGNVSGSGSGSGFAVARFNLDGKLDTTFGTGGQVTAAFSSRVTATNVVLQPDGKIIVVGSTSSGSDHEDLALAQYDANGKLDTTFGTGGQVTTVFGSRTAVAGVVLQSDGKIVVVGSTSSSPDREDLALARYDANGTPDATFGAGGQVITAFGGLATAAGVVLQSDGKIVVAGTVSGGFALARYLDSSPSDRFVIQVYQALVQSPTDSADVARWSRMLDQCGHRDPVVQMIENSRPYWTKVVQDLYNSLLGRPADRAGLDAFVNFLGNGGRAEQAAAIIAGSSEYFQKRGGGTNQGFLDALYQDALHRAVDANGRDFFERALAGGATPGQVATSIFTSPEYYQGLVQNSYQRFLHRPAEPSSLNSFVNALQQGMRGEQVLAAILGSEEYLANALVHVNSLSTMQALPGSLLTITGSGFDPAASLSVRFFNGQNFSLTVPVIDVQPTTLTVPVPPYFDATRTLGAGTVKVTVVKNGTVTSNTVTGFQIQNLPTPVAPAGTTTLSLLRATASVAALLQNDIKNTPLDTASINASLATHIANLNPLIANVQAVVQNPSQTFSLGQIGGRPVTIGIADLQRVDRLILGVLEAIGASGSGSARSFAPLTSGRASTPTSNGSIASTADAYNQGALQGDPKLDTLAQDFMNAPGQPNLNNTAEAFTKAFQVVGGSAGLAITVLVLAGLPGEALALPTAALLYVTIAGAGGMIADGGYLGQATAGASRVVQAGVETLEGLLEAFVLKGTAAGIGAGYGWLVGKPVADIAKTFGAVVGLSGSIWALYQGFAHAAAVAPSPGISVAPTSGLVTTEAGGQATFQVNLNSRPKDTVSINLASDNPAQGTVSPSGASIFI
jgi:uncharacterized delta-60 repeat protein